MSPGRQDQNEERPDSSPESPKPANRQIDKAEYEKRLKRLTTIFGDMVDHAQEQALTRCPYKNRLNQCTAQFGCQNKRRPRDGEDLPACSSDDQLDYRTAWEADPDLYDELRKSMRRPEDTAIDASARVVACEGRACPSETGRTIFDFADRLGVTIPNSCGRHGHCHECIVQIRHGGDALSSPNEIESFLKGDYRLACQAYMERNDLDVEFSLLRRAPKILTAGGEDERPSVRAPELDPLVTRCGETVFYGDEPIDNYRGNILGLSIDLGTTTVVAELVDLENGETVYQMSFENPQRFGGSDVMNRISYDLDYTGELHRAIINTLNTELREMYRSLNVSRHELYEIVVVGNSTMRELFFNHDVQPIGQRPYKSEIELECLSGKRDTTARTQEARKLRILANRKAHVYGPPLVASHAGSDVTANLVAIDIESECEVVLLVDAGTNTEVVLGYKDRLISASCPAGPAFEGGLVKYGMPGCDGAIESVSYDKETASFRCETIGRSEPHGICGSGLIDILAELSRNKLMTPKGVFANKAKEFVIDPTHGITFSRRDASELAQAKAANYCGQVILMRAFGIRPEEISKLYLAGGFANYVDSRNAIDIGFLAPVPADRIVKIGNGAARGARELLLSKQKRDSIERFVGTIEHVELETTADFFEVFVDGCQIKPMQLDS